MAVRQQQTKLTKGLKSQASACSATVSNALKVPASPRLGPIKLAPQNMFEDGATPRILLACSPLFLQHQATLDCSVSSISEEPMSVHDDQSLLIEEPEVEDDVSVEDDCDMLEMDDELPHDIADEHYPQERIFSSVRQS